MVAAGGDPTKLDQLEKYRDQYQEQINILTQRMQAGDESDLMTEDDLCQTVQQLYSLKHYGPQLRQIKFIVKKVHADTFHEEAHYIRARSKRWAESGTSNNAHKPSGRSAGWKAHRHAHSQGGYPDASPRGGYSGSVPQGGHSGAYARGGLPQHLPSGRVRR